MSEKTKHRNCAGLPVLHHYVGLTLFPINGHSAISQYTRVPSSESTLPSVLMFPSGKRALGSTHTSATSAKGT